MVDFLDPYKSLQAVKNLPAEVKEKLKCFLLDNLDIFAWKHEEMVGIDSKVTCHHLKIDSKDTLHSQKRRALNLERYETLKDEVKKLIDDRFI